jgi:hypothetical protein
VGGGVGVGVGVGDGVAVGVGDGVAVGVGDAVGVGVAVGVGDGDGVGVGLGVGAAATATECTTLSERPRASDTVSRTYLVPVPEKVNPSGAPLPSGQLSLPLAPTSAHVYEHGVAAHDAALANENVTCCPATGLDGENENSATGVAGVGLAVGVGVGLAVGVGIGVAVGDGAGVGLVAATTTVFDVLAVRPRASVTVNCTFVVPASANA